MMEERFLWISVVVMVVLGCMVGAAAALPDPFFSDPGTTHQKNYLTKIGTTYAYEYGKDVTNAGDAGDVYFTIYTDHHPLSSLVFPMEAGESVTAWSYYSGSPPIGMDRGYWTVRAATAQDANISNNYLHIERWTPPPAGTSIRVISPNGGENWVSGETHPVTWTTTGLEGYHVTISLYRWYDEFGAWKKHSDLVSDLLATEHSYDWTVPELPAPADYKIRIWLGEDDYHHLPLDYSDTVFSAHGSDISPPRGVTALRNTTFASSSIRWNWTEPADPDFAHVLVWVDGKKLDGVFTFGWCYISGLSPDTVHTISTRTVDAIGNINKTWVNHTARTAPDSVPLPKTMIGVFRTGQWILDYDMDRVVDRRLSYGLATDTTLVGDFNNDGTMDIGVFRLGQWILDHGMDRVVDRRLSYGLATDIPVVGIAE